MILRKLPYRFRENMRYAEDYLLWMQVVLDRIPVGYLNIPLAAIMKPAYGSAGLSGELWLMEKGELDAYWYLCREGKVSYPSAIGLTIYSLLKYIRRVMLTKLKRK